MTGSQPVLINMIACRAVTHLELDEMEDVWVRRHNVIASCLRSRENVTLNKGREDAHVTHSSSLVASGLGLTTTKPSSTLVNGRSADIHIHTHI